MVGDSQWEPTHETSFGVRIAFMVVVAFLVGVIAATITQWVVTQEWFPVAVTSWVADFFIGLIAFVGICLRFLYLDGSSSEDTEPDPYWGDDFDDVSQD